MPRWLTTLLRLTPIVAAASVVSVLGLIVFRAVAPLEEIHGSSGELGNYLQTVGGIYAVLLAFVVFVVWGQFNDARGYVDREATALIDLYRTASGLPDATRIAIQDGLRDYVDSVVRDEWIAMARHDDAAVDRTGEKLDPVWVAIHHCTPADACQHTVWGEILSRFNTLTDLRTSRLTSARFRIPLTMRILLYSGAVIVVGSMYLITIPQLWLHAFVTAALAGAIAHVLYLIVDLDDAFAGNMQVAKRPFEQARISFDRNSHLVAIDRRE
ncbi:MAG: hypothetical protein H6Q90_979 [Deltaproteobacteria bacterium]|nr:hypothetical protein [Deltaproteobacteria bacterium]